MRRKTIMLAFLLMAATSAFSADCKSPEYLRVTKGKQEMSHIQSGFDSLITQIVRCGITNTQQLQNVLGLTFVPEVGKSSPSVSLNFKAGAPPSGTGIVSVHYYGQQEPSGEDSLPVLSAATLSIKFAPAEMISAIGVAAKYEHPVYLLPPTYNSLAYFHVGEMDVYLVYDPVANIKTKDGSDAVSEVVFSWNRNHDRPNFPSLTVKKD
jgi:hypothetical protein